MNSTSHSPAFKEIGVDSRGKERLKGRVKPLSHITPGPMRLEKNSHFAYFCTEQFVRTMAYWLIFTRRMGPEAICDRGFQKTQQSTGALKDNVQYLQKS